MMNESVSSYFRITTNGTMRMYRSNLLGSRNRLTSAMTKVLTHRQFNSYAEDPAAASNAWQLRRGLFRTEDQLNNVHMLTEFNQAAWTALDAICDGTVDSPGLNGYGPILVGLNDADAGGRKALGQEILQEAESIISNMNIKYGDTYVFAGSDGLNAPFTFENGILRFRGINVDCEQMEVKTKEDFLLDDKSGLYDEEAYYAYMEEYKNSDYGKLERYSQEKGYVDIGMGLQERYNEETKEMEFVTSTGYDGWLCGLNYLGFGKDEDGDSNNIVLLMREAGQILNRCDADTGEFANQKEDPKRLDVLVDKILSKIHDISEHHVELTARTNFLERTEVQLKERSDLLNEQREGIEGIDPADAITEMFWANYCYNAALKIGNSILSESLLDYMR